MKNFGLGRVAEPKGSLPVTAWKLDNSKNLGAGEVRVRLKRIVLERENFYQLCSICQYDDDMIKERLFKIVSERGKLHNPYTESSGLFCGTVEEVSPDYNGKPLKTGDYVVCMAPMAGLPVNLFSIDNIDIYYGEITCDGYAICFETSTFEAFDDVSEEQEVYLLRALEEEGSIYGIAQEIAAKQPENAIIIGSNLCETILYAQMVRNVCVNPVRISFAIDSNFFGGITQNDLRTIFGSLIDEIHFVNLGKPVDSVKMIMENETKKQFDVIINLENVKGCESIASLMAAQDSLVCYMSLNSRYTQGLLVVDCLGKDVVHYGLDGYNSHAYGMALELVNTARPILSRLNEFYASLKKKPNYVPERSSERTKAVVQQIDGFIYKSELTASMVEEILNVSRYDCNVIIQGETGVGKERVFDLIHENSPRRDKPCIKINCATIQESLAESEFFGYEKGSFTGAQSTGKEGYFELANNGTLFMDEIGSLSLVMQSKLLRVLQENTYYRVGGTQPKHVNVRVICANNIPLQTLVDEGKFREDLYYRLNICLINVPPLRFRKEDISVLADTFIKNYSKKYKIRKELAPDAYKQLEAYHWPGNVRELENTIHRLYIAEKGNIIDGYSVDCLINRNVPSGVVMDLKREISLNETLDLNHIMAEQEKKLVAYALQKKGSTRKAAEYLGIPQTTLARKKLKYDL